jgi:hypothetical protein
MGREREVSATAQNRTPVKLHNLLPFKVTDVLSCSYKTSLPPPRNEPVITIEEEVE